MINGGIAIVDVANSLYNKDWNEVKLWRSLLLNVINLFNHLLSWGLLVLFFSPLFSHPFSFPLFLSFLFCSFFSHFSFCLYLFHISCSFSSFSHLDQRRKPFPLTDYKRPTDGRLTANRRTTNGQQSADERSTNGLVIFSKNVFRKWGLKKYTRENL